MPLSKARMRERKRQDRVNVKPKSNLNDTQGVKPNTDNLVKPNVRPFSKESQLKTFGELKKQFDYRFT